MGALQQQLMSHGAASGPTTPPTRTVGWTAAAISSTTLSSNITTTGSNRALLAFIGIDSATTTVTGVTFNGSQNFVFVGRQTQTGKSIEIWALVAPAVTTGAVHVTVSASALITMEYVHFTGVNQTTPVENFIGTNGSGTSASLTVTSNSGSRVVGSIVNHNAVTSRTKGAGQTDLTDDGNLASGTDENQAGSYKTGSLSASFSYTLSSGENWAMAAVSLRGL